MLITRLLVVVLAALAASDDSEGMRCRLLDGDTLMSTGCCRSACLA